MHKRTFISSLSECKRLEKKMIKCVLIYLWLYIGIYCAIEAGDADEHVHIKLHMPKTGTRKTVHHHHTRHKKNPPPYAPPTHGHVHPSALGSGPGITHSHIYDESPHNYLTASGAQQTIPHHSHHSHHVKRLPSSLSSSSSSVTHLQPVGGQHQELMDTEFYTNEDGATAEGTDIAGSVLDTNGDFMLKDFLTANFASFPQPTAFEAEIMSPQTNAELAYQSQRARGEEQHHPHSLHHQHHHRNYRRHQPPHQYYDGAAADVVAANHELEEDNEILGALGRTTYPLEDSEWTTHHAKPYRGLSSLNAMKNEHLLKHIMQQDQQSPSSSSLFPYQPEITNTVASSAMLRASNGNYRDDKLHKMSSGGGGRGDDIIEAMKAYEDMDITTTYSDGGQRGGAGGAGSGIKALTVDDIWSQLQRTYLNKYAPQAQSAMGINEGPPKASKKHKRQSPKLKTRKHQQHHHIRAATLPSPTSFPALNYENNYYSQESQPTAKQSTFYDSHHHKPTHTYASFSPYSVGSSSSSSADMDTNSFETRATAVTRPYHHNFNSAILFDAAASDENSSSSGGDDTAEEDDTVTPYHSDIDDKQHPGEDFSSEESMFSASHKKYGNNRSHRHSHANVAYGNVNLNNPFNYHDLYASYSTPIGATIATHKLPVVSTYHPNSYSATHASPAPAQQSEPTVNHESTSYQWREQQHYPASVYQGYHTSSSSQQQQQQQQQNQNRPQHQQLLQPYQPQSTSALRLPKATVASTVASSSLSLAQYHPLASSSSSSSSSPSSYSENDFTSAVKHSSIQPQQQRYKKRKNRLKSKRNRIVVT